MTADSTADVPSSADTLAAPAPARDGTSVLLVMSLVLSIVFLIGITYLMAAPAGGCGGG